MKRTTLNRLLYFTIITAIAIYLGLNGQAGLLQAEQGKPQIIIDNPASGWTALKVVEIKGRARNHNGIKEISMTFNGVTRFLPLNRGNFKQKVVLGAGTNYFKFSAANASGQDTASLKLVTNNQKLDLKVILFWDTNHTDVDLWVTDPNKEKVYYAHKNSKIGGSLDIDITNGYGPETFTLPRAIPGQYLIQVQYYGGRKPTLAKIIVILYQGTSREKKYIFPALLTKKGAGITIGKFSVK